MIRKLFLLICAGTLMACVSTSHRVKPSQPIDVGLVSEKSESAYACGRFIIDAEEGTWTHTLDKTIYVTWYRGDNRTITYFPFDPQDPVYCTAIPAGAYRLLGVTFTDKSGNIFLEKQFSGSEMGFAMKAEPGQSYYIGDYIAFHPSHTSYMAALKGFYDNFYATQQAVLAKYDDTAKFSMLNALKK